MTTSIESALEDIACTNIVPQLEIKHELQKNETLQKLLETVSTLPNTAQVSAIQDSSFQNPSQYQNVTCHICHKHHLTRKFFFFLRGVINNSFVHEDPSEVFKRDSVLLIAIRTIRTEDTKSINSRLRF